MPRPEGKGIFDRIVAAAAMKSTERREKTARLVKQLQKERGAYRHGSCGTCGISSYYAGVLSRYYTRPRMTVCETRGERHVWTYEDGAKNDE